MKYRIVKDIDSLWPRVTYNIEKQERFLFWTWWSRNYLWSDYDSYYSYDNYDEALNHSRVLNGDKPRIEKVVVPGYHPAKEVSPICLNCGASVRALSDAQDIFVHVNTGMRQCICGPTTAEVDTKRVLRPVVSIDWSDLVASGLTPPGLTIEQMMKQINYCLKQGHVKKDDMVLLAEPGEETYIVLGVVAPSLRMSSKYNFKNTHLCFGKYEKQQSINSKEPSPMKKTKR
jgi:hypothetical protein